MRLPLLLALLSVGCWGDEAASVAGEEFDAPELAKLLLKESRQYQIVKTLFINLLLV